MAGKTPGTPRKSSSKKAAASQDKEKNVTPINQGTGSTAENKKNPPAHLPKGLEQAGLEEEIRIRAYEIYVERGCQHGKHQEDWSRAEIEILSRFQREKSA
jgi:hypothetical protein